ncbi:pyridoxine/pyridoxamine 5'-phosphate oxidase [Candidatus Photodesmus katoptron]|uniref:Pyridoxine/pyridoxamine 5'-phosphate oxidase n=1 Tax=Candidatus Photodesmus katoptron Akat1 TaxID=1236703 RepID=S3DHZ1_9GAMM|nr:pyridoxamine 5'-phosphate oxidase [Candidatus Photodesmus katoptron]EPE37290.1 pyridoxamine 5'-phosphate oxidase [Candidatus Photodesmus katoptron Akat1]KEY90039.1 pyridoxine/pyridoxamine 5'-phosphate oxidase [Candidatus Photodesmus katoptron]
MKCLSIRNEYVRSILRRRDLNPDPIEQFKLWLQQSIDEQVIDSTTMTIATVDKNNQPFQRIVLLKGIDTNGFVFYTNFSSRKAKQIALNKKVSLLFFWGKMERQVHITGIAKKMSLKENIRYFYSRPKENQIASLVSKQSSKITSYSILENAFLKLKKKFDQENIPAPKFWGGFRINPETIEFWQGGKYRLHDRFLFSRNNNHWTIDRLAP